LRKRADNTKRDKQRQQMHTNAEAHP
jgi:hypothetical protein